MDRQQGQTLTDNSGSVTISDNGNLVLLDARNQTVWSTNATTTSSSPMNTTLQILDTGNLLLRDNATGNTVWDSFSHPTDVFMPTMNLTHNINTGQKVMLSSWKNESDPEVGTFTAGIEAAPIPQFIIWNDGRPHWRSGQWDGLLFLGVKDMYSSYVFIYSLVKDREGSYKFTAREGEYLTNIQLGSSGTIVQTVWDGQKRNWDAIWFTPTPGNDCDLYGKCGPFGTCNTLRRPICSCMRGFEPVNKGEWQRGNWSSGCQRRKLLQCGGGGGGGGDVGGAYFGMRNMKVPDFAMQYPSIREEECRNRCSNSCECIAYAHHSRIGCLYWNNTLIDSQEFNTVGLDLYVRVSPSELDDNKDKRHHIIIASVVGSVSVVVLVFIAWCWIIKRKGNKTKDKILEAEQTADVIPPRDEPEIYSIEKVPSFTFETLASATNQFDELNVLGRGGFGTVYKGNLEIGKEIAVKRLSAASGQGVREFMNEVEVISKLQHRNLVKLLGCCAEKDEKMLVYEYMPKRSLDDCLFDPTNPSQKILDWPKRLSIIEGIGRGLLYLHKDSRLKIIHRDLKPSNVLLDEDWNPKISDFGIARIFGNEDHDSTAKVVGTYGYMAPEYAVDGRFSEKSDVYSFGVLVLEIIKGKKNTQWHSDNELSLGLLGTAWKLWSEGNAVGFADERIASTNFVGKIARCIQIGLLCVQELPKDRPTIQTVLSMLNSEIVDLPPPEQPMFDEKWSGLTTNSDQVGHSINGLSLTVLDGR